VRGYLPLVLLVAMEALPQGFLAMLAVKGEAIELLRRCFVVVVVLSCSAKVKPTVAPER
jgi:hypothetical protein